MVRQGNVSMHILIFQGSPEESQRANGEFGGLTNEALFNTALQSKDASVKTFTLNVADGEKLPQGMGLGDFDGVVITGSPLSTYEDSPAVRTQMDLARDVFHAGIPTFGSCWGLQLMSAALGGDVRLNPKGREMGIARTIILNDTGRTHAMYRDKPVAFDAFCSHRDEVQTLPTGGTVLASNSVSDIQAAEIVQGEKCFWGVQYHPEMNFGITAMLMEKRAERYIAEGFARNAAEIAIIVADFRTLEKVGSARPDLLWRYGITPDVLDTAIRRAEFGAWLQTKVKPYAVGKS
jgi:GMP synthase (glutamine-hydrolysing)